MPKFDVCNRSCVYVPGSGKSQSISVLAEPCVAGVYDWVVRLEAHVSLNSVQEAVTNHPSIESFIKWLKDAPSIGGQIERVPPEQDALVAVDRHTSAASLPYTEALAKLAESHIDRIVTDFLRYPYRHRTENNIHCELYSAMSPSPLLKQLFQLEDGETVVQLLHREWPSHFAVKRVCGFDLNIIWPMGGPTQSSVPPQGRGKYDLAILDPEVIAQFDVPTFSQGAMPPVLVIECGLNARFEHLRENIAKLSSNGVPRAYVLHLIRTDAQPDNYRATEKLLELSSRNTNVRSAYARVGLESGRPTYHYKYTNGTTITSGPTLPTSSH